MKIGELFVQLGVKADTMTVNQFAGALGNMRMMTASLITGLIGASLELKNISINAMETAANLTTFQNQTGLSADELQHWQMIAERANVSTQSVSSSMLALQRSIAEIRMGRGNIAPFRLLGIEPNANPFQIIEQLRSKINTMPRYQFVNLIQQMGISPDMINLLTLTNKELKAMSGDDLILSDKNRKKLNSLKRDFTEFRQEMVFFGQNLAVYILPHITQLIRFFENIVTSISKSKEAFIGLGVVITGLALAFRPIYLAVAGLLLLLDDLATYESGGDSLIGRLFGKKGEEKTDIAKAQSQTPMIGKLLGFNPDKAIQSHIVDPLKNIFSFFDKYSTENMHKINMSGGSLPISTNVVQNIHSTAPAKEVADESAAAITRAQINTAKQQFNTGGR